MTSGTGFTQRLFFGLGEEAAGPIPNPLSGPIHEPVIREVGSMMAVPRACRSLKGARPMYPSGFEGARGWVQCVGRLVWGVMGCCVICMMGFGFNLVEVLWVGSRLVCVAGAGRGCGWAACGGVLLGLGCCDG